MIPISFEGVNTVFMSEGCFNVPAMVVKGKVEGLGIHIVTVWRITDIEIEKLKQSHCIQLNIMGAGFPPLSLQVIDVEDT
jgi:hypothetical protein